MKLATLIILLTVFVMSCVATNQFPKKFTFPLIIYKTLYREFVDFLGNSSAYNDSLDILH